MSLSGWGNFPRTDNEIFSFTRNEELREIIAAHDDLISYGNGRSYGDSALSKKILRAESNNFFLRFDASNGLLHVQASVLLSEIVDVFVPIGWFLKITPGTKFISVGGAIASDVHGKNHHRDGCFSECVNMFRLMLPNGDIVTCSKKENNDLFRATCGGMGLTGVILDAEIFLIKINSKLIHQTTVKTGNLQETFEVFEEYRNYTYSVAWLDCFAKKEKTGKCLITMGEFCEDGDLKYKTKSKVKLTVDFPSIALNKYSIKAFNYLYYNKAGKKTCEDRVDIDGFFYPLDAIENWNRIYGKKGFTQYQFIMPLEASYEGIRKILECITATGKSSFLAVLKLYGQANDNYLSFPMEGYSLALDFRIEKEIFKLFDRLDGIVLDHGGRIYLAKDARVSSAVFERGYPQIDKFRELRRKYHMDRKFNSFQSQRVGI